MRTHLPDAPIGTGRIGRPTLVALARRALPLTYLPAPRQTMATQSKAQFLNDVHGVLKKHYKPKPEPSAPRFTVLEAVVYGICHEGTTREQANQAAPREAQGRFFDWNEVRVSTIEEIRSGTGGFTGDRGSRRQRIRRFLRQLFERTYSFNLETLVKKPLKESLKVLNEYEAFQPPTTSLRPSFSKRHPAVAVPGRPPDSCACCNRLKSRKPMRTLPGSVRYSNAPFPRTEA